MTAGAGPDAVTATRRYGVPAGRRRAGDDGVPADRIRMTVHVELDALTAMYRSGAPAALPVAVVPEVTVLRGPGSG